LPIVRDQPSKLHLYFFFFGAAFLAAAFLGAAFFGAELFADLA
jgi:hypothetical protein